MKQEFDWDVAEERSKNKRWFKWLRANHAMPITEEKYLESRLLLVRVARKTGDYAHLKRNWRNKLQKKKIKHTYRLLRERFGFFPTI